MGGRLAASAARVVAIELKDCGLSAATVTWKEERASGLLREIAMRRKILTAALLALAMLNLAGCFYASSSSTPGSTQTVCDPTATNCQSTTKSSSWGFFF
jgi:hypothetical protein